MSLEQEFQATCKAVWHRGYRACRQKLLTVLGQHLAGAVTLGQGLDPEAVRRLYNALRNAPMNFPGIQNPYSPGSGGHIPSDVSRVLSLKSPPEGIATPGEGDRG